MNFQIRLADTGHQERIALDGTAKGENIFNHINNVYRINQKDQLLLTKIGHCIQPEHILRQVLTEQRNDKTMVGKDYNKLQEEKVSCIYLYNLREIAKPGTPLQHKFKSFWLDELKQEIKTINNLRPAITNFDSLTQLYPQQTLETYPKAVQMINSLRNSYIKLDNQYVQLKQIHAKIQQLMFRCQFQRKSVQPLSRYLIGKASRLKQRANDIYSKKQSLKKSMMIQDKSLRQNSSYFQLKKKQEQNIQFHQQKMSELKSLISNNVNKMKDQIKQTKQKFKSIQKKIISYSNQKIDQIIENKAKKNLEQYHNILNSFRLLIDTQDYKYINQLEIAFNNVEINFREKENQEYQTLYQTLTDSYCEFSELNERNIYVCRETYRNFIGWKETISALETQVTQELTTISDLLQQDYKSCKEISFSQKNNSAEQISFCSANSEKNLQSFKISIKTEAETKRRVKFYRKLHFIQTIADNICQQEQELRKKYVQENKVSKQNNKELLRNPKVPSIDIDYNGTTDLEIFKNNQMLQGTQPDSMQADEFMLLQYSRIIEKITKLVGADLNSKIQNMQEILKSVSDIFYKVYNQKYQNLIRQKEAEVSKVNDLEVKLSKLTEDLESNKSAILSLQLTVKEKQQSLAQLQNNRNEEIIKQKAKYQRALNDKKSLEGELKKQIKLTEELFTQVTLGDQDIQNLRQEQEQLKILLGEREVYIIRLENELGLKSSQPPPLQLPKGESQLKSIVIDNLSQKIQQSEMAQSQTISQLQKQNSLLQNENDLLQEQIETLSSELRKIIMKQTEETETQTNNLNQSNNRKEQTAEEIHIGEEITVGQTAIFMPFNNNLYIGVCPRDEDRTLCNVNTIHHSHYILDIESFNSKTRELLSQCSFLAVVKVQHLKKDNNNFSVLGKIQYLLGFEDDNLTVRNYAPYLI